MSSGEEYVLYDLSPSEDQHHAMEGDEEFDEEGYEPVDEALIEMVTAAIDEPLEAEALPPEPARYDFHPSIFFLFFLRYHYRFHGSFSPSEKGDGSRGAQVQNMSSTVNQPMTVQLMPFVAAKKNQFPSLCCLRFLRFGCEVRPKS